MSSSNRESKEGEEDVVEMKKAIATGGVKQESPAASSSVFCPCVLPSTARLTLLYLM